MRVSVNTDIAGKPVKGKNYTAELAQLIAESSGGVRDGQRQTRPNHSLSRRGGQQA